MRHSRPFTLDSETESSDELKKHEPSKEDRIALAKIVKNNDRSKIFLELRDGNLRAIDFVVFSEDANPLLSYSPLEIAALNQYWALVSTMLSRLRPIVGTVDQTEQENMRCVFSKCVFIAAFYRQSALVLEFLSLGADPNLLVSRSTRFKGHSALHFAIEDKSDTTIKALVAAGADPLLITEPAPSALDYALHLARYRDPDYWRFIPLLMNKPLEEAMPKEIKKTYFIMLSYACMYNQTEVAQHLLSMGADPNEAIVTAGSFKGYTALHFAHRNNNKVLAFYLLAAGANPDDCASDGTTFRSLASTDSDFRKVLGAPNNKIQETAKYYLEDFPEILTSKRIGEASLWDELSDAASSAWENMFSFFGFSTDAATERSERKLDHLQQQVSQTVGRMSLLDTRVEHLENQEENRKKDRQHENVVSPLVKQRHHAPTHPMYGSLSSSSRGSKASTLSRDHGYADNHSDERLEDSTEMNPPPFNF